MRMKAVDAETRAAGEGGWGGVANLVRAGIPVGIYGLPSSGGCEGSGRGGRRERGQQKKTKNNESAKEAYCVDSVRSWTPVGAVCARSPFAHTPGFFCSAALLSRLPSRVFVSVSAFACQNMPEFIRDCVQFFVLFCFLFFVLFCMCGCSAYRSVLLSVASWRFFTYCAVVLLVGASQLFCLRAGVGSVCAYVAFYVKTWYVFAYSVRLFAREVRPDQESSHEEGG